MINNIKLCPKVWSGLYENAKYYNEMSILHIVMIIFYTRPLDFQLHICELNFQGEKEIGANYKTSSKYGYEAYSNHPPKPKGFIIYILLSKTVFHETQKWISISLL